MCNSDGSCTNISIIFLPDCKVECGADEWQCNSDCTCIKISQRCNGVEDCMERLDKPEVSDEYDCPEESKCVTHIGKLAINDVSN